MLSDARRVTTGPYGQLRVRKDYSYCDTAFWRPGMVLIGDAACFVDPVFSSGVHLATYSGLLAARSINTVLAGTLPEERVFAEYAARYRREYRLFYEFLLSFYEMHVDESSYFWQAKKVTNSQGSDLESFVNLVGGVASGETALSLGAGGVRTRVRETAQELSDATAGADGANVSLFSTRTVADVMEEGSRIQAQALLGADADDPPTVDGGLDVSTDSLGWEDPALVG
jgi:halogenation protein CepH